MVTNHQQNDDPGVRSRGRALIHDHPSGGCESRCAGLMRSMQSRMELRSDALEKGLEKRHPTVVLDCPACEIFPEHSLSCCPVLGIIESTGDKSVCVGGGILAVTVPGGVGANWLGVTEKNGGLDVWFQPTGGHVVRVQDIRVDGTHMSLKLSPPTDKAPALVWELDAGGGRLTGIQKRGDRTASGPAWRAPDLKRTAPKAWTIPGAAV